MRTYITSNDKNGTYITLLQYTSISITPTNWQPLIFLFSKCGCFNDQLYCCNTKILLDSRGNGNKVIGTGQFSGNCIISPLQNSCLSLFVTSHIPDITEFLQDSKYCLVWTGPNKVRTTVFSQCHLATLALAFFPQGVSILMPSLHDQDSKHLRQESTLPRNPRIAAAGLEWRWDTFSTQSQRWSFSPSCSHLLGGTPIPRRDYFHKLQHDKDQNNLTCDTNVEIGQQKREKPAEQWEHLSPMIVADGKEERPTAEGA